LPQVAVLLLMAAQVPLMATKSMPDPAELMTLRLMFIVQMSTAALLFPFLFRDARSATLVILSAIPMTLLAAFLAGAVAKWKMVYSIGYSVEWLLGLALWRTVLRSNRSQALGIAAALLVLFAGVIFWYLRAEYRVQSDSFDLDEVEGWSPIFGAFTAALYGRLRLWGWLLAAGWPTLAALVAFISWRLRRPQLPETA
jgi:hypothetical protein